jgi:beta-N-acetylhexosaminidase
VDVTQSWSEEELLPYRRLIDRGLLDAVLTAHVHLRQFDPDRPATLSERVVTGLLREKLDFDGLVITDDLNMGAIQAHYTLEEAVEGCVRAGADVVLHANVSHYEPEIASHTIRILRMLVEQGRLTADRVEQSHGRVMALKRRLGLV